MSKRMIQLIFDDDTLPVSFCPWRTSLCDVFLAELSYHSFVLFSSLPVTYVLYRDRELSKLTNSELIQATLSDKMT